MVKSATNDRMQANKQLGGFVSEVLYAIKVVATFEQENLELNRFTEMSNNTR